MCVCLCLCLFVSLCLFCARMCACVASYRAMPRTTAYRRLSPKCPLVERLTQRPAQNTTSSWPCSRPYLSYHTPTDRVLSSMCPSSNFHEICPQELYASVRKRGGVGDRGKTLSKEVRWHLKARFRIHTARARLAKQTRRWIKETGTPVDGSINWTGSKGSRRGGGGPPM